VAAFAAPGPVDVDASIDVAVLRWPAEAAAVAMLRDAGLPRLLLVDPDAEPPLDADCRQDWVRTPADGREIELRRRALHWRARAHRPAPTLDGYGRLLHGGRWAALSPVEDGLVRPLIASFGAVVPYATLVTSAWPDGAPSENALRLHFMRLRRKLQPLGLELRSVRSCGVVLEEAGPVASSEW
jgi:hypothetical protein